jgi:hypothetical protein
LIIEQVLEARAGRARELRARGHLAHEVQHVAAAAARRDHRVDLVAVEQRSDAVAVPREQARQHRDEVGGHRALAHLARAEVHRRGEIEQEPGVDVAILVVLAHVRRLQARGDVPVDAAHIVVVLVLAQVGEVQAEAAEQRAVIAMQEAVKTAYDRPFQLLQKLFKIPRWLPGQVRGVSGGLECSA